MLDTSSNSGGDSSLFFRLTSRSWPWLIVAMVGIALSGLLASPAYAWWFTPSVTQSAVTPIHQQGLVVSPIAQALVPQFILQPLSQTIVEAPPEQHEATPAPTPVPTAKPTLALTKVAPSAPAVASTENYSSVAQRVLDLVNQRRSSAGLGQLTLNSSLTASAQAYAEYMSSAKFFSHTGLNGSKFTQRDEAAGYTGWSWLEENIAYGQASAEMVIQDWMDSPEHRDNILNPHVKELGVGMAGRSPIYWVQEFGVR